jgi:hypothetical protein
VRARLAEAHHQRCPFSDPRVQQELQAVGIETVSADLRARRLGGASDAPNVLYAGGTQIGSTGAEHSPGP